MQQPSKPKSELPVKRMVICKDKIPWPLISYNGMHTEKKIWYYLNPDASNNYRELSMFSYSSNHFMCISLIKTHNYHEIGTIISPILKTQKLRVRELSDLPRIT